MANYKRRRSALLNVIQGLEDSDVVSDDVVEMDEIEETIPETTEACDSLPEDKDQETIVSDEELEAYFESLDDEEEETACDQVEACGDKIASETESGIEDEITDTANGGDPTTSEVAPGGDEAKSEVQEDSEVYPTESAYVASLVRKFDRIATELEKKGMKRLAYRLDVLSDKLEKQYK